MATQVFLPGEHSLNRGGDKATDVRVGGQNGSIQNYTTMANAGALTKQRLMAVLWAPPTGMLLMDNGSDRVEFLKALIELWSKSITGLNRSKTWEYNETVLGNDGNMMETPNNATRERSVPVHVYDEIKGKAITHFFEDWGDMLVMDAGLKYPGIIATDAYTAAGSPQITPLFRGATVLYIEPNSEMTGVQSAFLVTNMMPKSLTDESASTVGEALEGMEQSVEFTGITQVGKAVDALALAYLNSLTKGGFQPASLAAAQAEISPDVSDNVAGSGNRPAAQAAADSLVE